MSDSIARKAQTSPASYVYQDANGAPHMRVNRTASKGFWQEHWTGTAWEKGAPSGPKILYRLLALLQADHNVVLIVEGEKMLITLPLLASLSRRIQAAPRSGSRSLTIAGNPAALFTVDRTAPPILVPLGPKRGARVLPFT
jgi:hypothetical protein